MSMRSAPLRHRPRPGFVSFRFPVPFRVCLQFDLSEPFTWPLRMSSMKRGGTERETAVAADCITLLRRQRVIGLTSFHANLLMVGHYRTGNLVHTYQS